MQNRHQQREEMESVFDSVDHLLSCYLKSIDFETSGTVGPDNKSSDSSLQWDQFSGPSIGTDQAYSNLKSLPQIDISDSNEPTRESGSPAITSGIHTNNEESWESIFMDALMKTPPPKTLALPECRQDMTKIMPIATQQHPHHLKPLTRTTSMANTEPKTIRKCRRRYVPRRVIPTTKEYIVDGFTDADVIGGRGHRTNKHPGNQEYLQQVEERKPVYKSPTTTETEKRRIILEIVDSIHRQGGRFLELDRSIDKWYVSPAKNTYIKVGQALRDKNDAATRAAKRKKYGRTAAGRNRT